MPNYTRRSEAQKIVTKIHQTLPMSSHEEIAVIGSALALYSRPSDLVRSVVKNEKGIWLIELHVTYSYRLFRPAVLEFSDPLAAATSDPAIQIRISELFELLQRPNQPRVRSQPIFDDPGPWLWCSANDVFVFLNSRQTERNANILECCKCLGQQIGDVLRLEGKGN